MGHIIRNSLFHHFAHIFRSVFSVATVTKVFAETANEDGSTFLIRTRSDQTNIIQNIVSAYNVGKTFLLWIKCRSFSCNFSFAFTPPWDGVLCAPFQCFPFSVCSVFTLNLIAKMLLHSLNMFHEPGERTRYVINDVESSILGGGHAKSQFKAHTIWLQVLAVKFHWDNRINSCSIQINLVLIAQTNWSKQRRHVCARPCVYARACVRSCKGKKCCPQCILSHFRVFITFEMFLDIAWISLHSA